MSLGLFVLAALIGFLVVVGGLATILFPRRFKPMKHVTDRSIRRLRHRVRAINNLGLYVPEAARELTSTTGVLIGKAAAALDWDRPQEGLPYANLASAALYWVETLVLGNFSKEHPHVPNQDFALAVTDQVDKGIMSLIEGELADAKSLLAVHDFTLAHHDLQRVILLAQDLRCVIVLARG